jgi:predicted nucleotidyltransferase
MPQDTTAPGRVIRDRDYLRDRHGVIFKVIGDVHPEGHYLGYVKYHPDALGDRRLFDRPYRQNTVVSKSFGLPADRCRRDARSERPLMQSSRSMARKPGASLEGV